MNKPQNFSEFVQKHQTKIFCTVCFLIVNIFMIVLLYPLDRPILGHDYQYHYLRLESVKYNIENNNLFSGIDYLFFDGGGYASSAYPDIFLLIPGLLRVMGISIGASMSLFVLLCSAFAYLFMFVFLKRVSNSPLCASMGAVLYVLSGYRLDNIITRFALGEVQAYVFWPLILYGLYDFIFRDFKKPHIIVLGFVGMLLSHTISTALALGLSAVISIIFFKRILAAPKKLLKLLAAAGCAVAVTAFYWLPLFELLFSCEMSVKNSPYHTLDYTVPFSGLFKENMHNGIAGMGFPIFLLCVPRIFLNSRSRGARKYLIDENTGKKRDLLAAADVFMTVGIILAVMSTTVFPWGFLSKFLDFMQFPWRLFAPASILLITAGAIYIYYIGKITKTPQSSALLVIALALLVGFAHGNISGVGHADKFEDDHYANSAETFHIGSGEWLPRTAQGSGLDYLRTAGDSVLLSSGKTIPCERKNGKLAFVLKGESADSVKLPYIWYKGYTARDGLGKALEISMSSDGLVQADLREAVGLITVEHRPTTLKTVSYFISAFSVVGIGAVAVILKKKHKKSAAE